MAEIVSTPDVLGGEPRIDGHRIGVLEIVELHEPGLSPAEVSDEPDVTVGAVEAARRYAEERPAELAEYEPERRRFHERLAGERKRSA